MLNVEDQEIILKYLSHEKPDLIQNKLKLWIELNRKLDDFNINLNELNKQFQKIKIVNFSP